MFQDAALD